MPNVRFTRHADEKFEMLKAYGFDITREQVADAISKPDRVERKGVQTLSLRALDDELALRVVHEASKGIIVVITFYPVKRERYGL